MTEEAKVDITPAPVEEPQYSDVEKMAMEKGWNPDKESVQADGKDWVTAEVFMAREPLFKDIHNLKRQVKSNEKAFNALQEHYKKLRESLETDRLSRLQKEKKEAVQIGDAATVDKLDADIDKVKEEIRNIDQQVQASQNTNTAFEDWKANNPWYGSDEDTTEYAEFIGNRLSKQKQFASYDEFYQEVTKKVKEKFPEKFEDKRSKPSPVEGSSTRSASATKSGKKYSRKDVPEEFRDIMKTLVKSGTLTEEQYIEDLVKAGYI